MTNEENITEIEQSIAQQCIDVILTSNGINTIGKLNEVICSTLEHYHTDFSIEFLRSCIPSGSLLMNMSLKDCVAHIWKEMWKVTSSTLWLLTDGRRPNPHAYYLNIVTSQTCCFILSGSWIRLMSDAEGVEKILSDGNVQYKKEELREYFKNIVNAIVQIINSAQNACSAVNVGSNLTKELSQSLFDYHNGVIKRTHTTT